MGCEKAHVAKLVCREFNTSRGCKRKQCGHLHEALSVALSLSTRPCKYRMTKAGFRKGIACDHRHVVPQKRVVLPLKDLCDLRSSNLFEYAPTRDNKRIEHDACSQHWSRVNDAAGAYPGRGPHIQNDLI